MTKSIVFTLVCTFFLLLLIWGSGLGWFYLTTQEKQADNSTQTDSIIVPTGGVNRINEGLALLSEGYAEKILISGVNEKVSLEQIIQMWGGKIDDPDCCVFIGHMAKNTAQNAEEARQWVTQKYIRSARLVTSNYHMPRAALEFHHAMPDIEIIEHAVMAEDKEYKNRGGFWRVIVGEYNKTILSWLRLSFSQRQVS